MCCIIKGSIEPNKAALSVHFVLCILNSGAFALSTLRVFSFKDTSNGNCLTWFSYYISLCVSYPKSRGIQHVIIINCMKQHGFKEWAEHDFMLSCKPLLWSTEAPCFPDLSSRLLLDLEHGPSVQMSQGRALCLSVVNLTK